MEKNYKITIVQNWSKLDRHQFEFKGTRQQASDEAHRYVQEHHLAPQSIILSEKV